MLFRVASLLGMTVERLLAEMAADEFLQWCAFYSLEPWGSEADNWRMGVQCATTANSAGRKKPLKPSDFMPKRRQSAREMKKALKDASTPNG